jgi:hypothetical protein
MQVLLYISYHTHTNFLKKQKKKQPKCTTLNLKTGYESHIELHDRNIVLISVSPDAFIEDSSDNLLQDNLLIYSKIPLLDGFFFKSPCKLRNN